MSEAAKGSAREPVLALYLALGMGIGPLTHYALSALGPLVVSDLGLSATQFGGLWLVAFGSAAACTGWFGGLTDRLGSSRMLRAEFLCAAAAMLAVSMAPSYPVLVVGVALAGAAVAISNPATNLAVATSVARGRQGLMVGAKQSGVQGGQLLAGLALPTLAVLWGWRIAVLMCVTLTVLGFLTTRWVVAPVAHPARPEHHDHAPIDPDVWWLTGYALVIGAAIQATNVYLPLYTHDQLGGSVGQAGLVAALLGGTGVAARIIWGRALDRIADVPALLMILAVAAAAGLVICSLAVYAGPLVWLGAALFGASALAANVVIMMAVVRTASAGSLGRATGWASLGLYLGFMAGPISFGLLIDSGAGYRGAWTYLCVLCAVLVSIALAWRRSVARRPGSHAPGSHVPGPRAPTTASSRTHTDLSSPSKGAP
jgi:predicted MFS family arabinose efflux permease